MKINDGIQGKVAANTRASRGHEEAIVILLATRGAKVVFGAHRTNWCG